MTARTRGARRHHNTAAKIVGTVGVLGVAATIAGLNTFGSFTDSTTPVGTQVDTGVLSIDVADAGDALSMPFSGGLMLAGDSRGYRLDLVNNGDVSLSGVTMTSRATVSSVLNTDTTHGLQLNMKNCTVPWTVSNFVYSCGGTQSTVYAGPIVTANLTVRVRRAPPPARPARASAAWTTCCSPRRCRSRRRATPSRARPARWTSSSPAPSARARLVDSCPLIPPP